jgi:esterase
MKLFYRKSGNGKPLIILHGLFGISDNWAALAKLWSAYFTVYAVDLRNHGQSPHGNEWNYKVMSEDIIELLSDEKLTDVTIIGHSMGGKVAMRLAIDYPLAISKLIVVDIAPRQSLPTNSEVIDALQQVDLNKLTSRKDAEEILRPLLREEGTIQFLLKNLFWSAGPLTGKDQPDGEKRLEWRFNLDVISKNIHEVYAATLPDGVCETNTLFIRGSKSQYIMPEDEASIALQFPNSEIVTIPDAGHWVHADQPFPVYEAVMKFAL